MGWRWIRTMVGYLLPPEVITAVFVVFSLENVLESLVVGHWPVWLPEWAAWLTFAVAAMAVSAYFAADNEDFEEDLEEAINGDD